MDRIYIDVKALVALALASGELEFSDLLEVQAESAEARDNYPVGYVCAYGATPSVFLATDRESGTPKRDRNGKFGLNVRGRKR